MSESINLSPSLDYLNSRRCEMTALGGPGGCLTWCPRIPWEGSDADANQTGASLGGQEQLGRKGERVSWLCCPARVPTVSLASLPGHPEHVPLPWTRSCSERFQGGAVSQGMAEPGRLYPKRGCKPSADSHKTN